MKIGFIGLGVMGRPMANNLVNNGYDVIAYDVVPEFVAEAAKFGAKAAASIKEAVCDSEIVITMLPNGSHVKSVALGEGGLAENAKQGTLLIDMSSISTTYSIEINEGLKGGVNVMTGEPFEVSDATVAAPQSVLIVEYKR